MSLKNHHPLPVFILKGSNLRLITVHVRGSCGRAVCAHGCSTHSSALVLSLYHLRVELTRFCKEKVKHQTDILPNLECMFMFYQKNIYRLLYRILLYRMCRNYVKLMTFLLRNREHIPHGGKPLKKLRLFINIFFRILTDALLEIFLIK